MSVAKLALGIALGLLLTLAVVGAAFAVTNARDEHNHKACVRDTSHQTIDWKTYGKGETPDGVRTC